MFLTRKHLSRRTVLKGAGATIALPVARCHDPGTNGAGADGRRRQPAPGLRVLPHGALQDEWTPTRTGRDFDFPFILKPLEPLREHVTVVSGLRNKGGESSSPHGIIEETWLSCVNPRRRDAKTGVGRDGGPDRRAAPGQGDVAAVAGALRRAGRHDLVPNAGSAAADGKQSAEGVLRHVRAGRYESKNARPF